MTEDNYNRFMTLAVTLTGIGFILLFFSTNIGFLLADNWLVKRGAEDTAMFQIRIENYINSFLVAGAILFAIGLITLIVTYFIKMNFTKE